MNLGNPEPLTCSVISENAGQRLDKFLVQCFPEQSRSRIQNWLEKSCVHKNNVPITDASYKVKAGEVYVIIPPPLLDAIPQAQALALDIIFEDEDLLVLNKAPGMVVHPAPGHAESTLVNALLAHCGDSLSGIGGVKRPGIVHRLDKDTSGLMVVAKNDRAHQILSSQFAQQENGRQLSRTYWALVWGQPNPSKGTINAPIGRHSTNRQKMAVVKGSSGKVAITHYQTKKIWSFGAKCELKISWVEYKLETGRTHQIRVHSQFIGHPLLGDPVYGRKSLASSKSSPKEATTFPRQALHAVQLSFLHPRTGEKMDFSCPLPQDFQNLIDHISSSA